ncbi:DUF6477 family protein [Frigidibacter sp. MR17.24]|uniref:DUF6477 family protein n=1 Tax=Frigidibacter sp. MR17.24 TaxID=3127345 RepID=UPI0030130C4B
MSKHFVAPKARMRPKLLLRAARMGLAQYRREPVLRRLLAVPVAPGPAAAVAALAPVEAGLEAQRRAGDPAYRPGRHVAVVIALIAERRVLAEPDGPEPGAEPGPGPEVYRKLSAIESLRWRTKAVSASPIAGSIAGLT